MPKCINNPPRTFHPLASHSYFPNSNASNTVTFSGQVWNNSGATAGCREGGLFWSSSADRGLQILPRKRAFHPTSWTGARWEWERKKEALYWIKREFLVKKNENQFFFENQVLLVNVNNTQWCRKFKKAVFALVPMFVSCLRLVQR